MTMTIHDAIYEAIGELGAALIQVSPSDDQIIIDHIRRAHDVLCEAHRAHQRSLAAAAIDAAASIAFDNITRNTAKEVANARV